MFNKLALIAGCEVTPFTKKMEDAQRKRMYEVGVGGGGWGGGTKDCFQGNISSVKLLEFRRPVLVWRCLRLRRLNGYLLLVVCLLSCHAAITTVFFPVLVLCSYP